MALTNSGESLLLNTRVSLDKIESFRNESFQPEEIQLYLNKSQFRLLDDLINKNFQEGTLRYEWLRPFLQTSTPITPLWDANADIPAKVDYPIELYYLISANGLVTKNGVNEETKFDDGCDQPIEDPADIPFPMSKFVQLDVIETGQAIDRTHNAFYGNNPRSPRSEVLKNGLRLYRDEKFIISGVGFEYVLQPEEINVASPDVLLWSVSACEKIVDYTVEYMRLTISDPTYQSNVNDFNTRTQNA